MRLPAPDGLRRLRLADPRDTVGARIRSDRRWHFAADADTVWSALTDTGSYRSWWPWLTRLDVDGDAFEPGAAWSCAVQPPLPYALRFSLHIEAVEVGQAVSATVSGDISGTASLLLDGEGDRTTVHLMSSLAPVNPFLRGVARVARPVVRFGHDWVLDTGASQFRRRALP